MMRVSEFGHWQNVLRTGIREIQWNYQIKIKKKTFSVFQKFWYFHRSVRSRFFAQSSHKIHTILQHTITKKSLQSDFIWIENRIKSSSFSLSHYFCVQIFDQSRIRLAKAIDRNRANVKKKPAASSRQILIKIFFLRGNATVTGKKIEIFVNFFWGFI